MNEKPSLYVANFLSLQLIGTRSNRAALGTEVTVQTMDGPHTQEVRSGGGYISQNDLRLHFGLGQADKAEKVTVRWPSGLVETLSELAANQFYVVREGQAIDPVRTRGVRQAKLPASDRTPK